MAELLRAWGLDKARRKLECLLVLFEADAKSRTNPAIRRWMADLKTLPTRQTTSFMTFEFRYELPCRHPDLPPLHHTQGGQEETSSPLYGGCSPVVASAGPPPTETSASSCTATSTYRLPPPLKDDIRFFLYCDINLPPPTATEGGQEETSSPLHGGFSPPDRPSMLRKTTGVSRASNNSDFRFFLFCGVHLLSLKGYVICLRRKLLQRFLSISEVRDIMWTGFTLNKIKEKRILFPSLLVEPCSFKHRVVFQEAMLYHFKGVLSVYTVELVKVLNTTNESVGMRHTSTAKGAQRMTGEVVILKHWTKPFLCCLLMKVLEVDSAANQNQALLIHNHVPGGEEEAVTASSAVFASPPLTPGCLLYSSSSTGSSMSCRPSCHLEWRGQREGPGPAAIGCHSSFSWSGDSRVCDDSLDPGTPQSPPNWMHVLHTGDPISDIRRTQHRDHPAVSTRRDDLGSPGLPLRLQLLRSRVVCQVLLI